MPKNYAKVYLQYEYDNWCYPPPSFWSIQKHQLGNGDSFGLYWPVGRENEEPIILEMWHDSMEMIPQFSSLDKFLEGSNLLPDTDDFLEPNLEVDEKSPVLLVKEAKTLMEKASFQKAIECLTIALDVLPEYTEALSMIAMLYRRLQNNALALEYAIRAFRCPKSFGIVNPSLWPWFQKMDMAPESVLADPFWKHRTELTWRFGKNEDFRNYEVLQTILDDYLENKQVVEWFLTSLTYTEYIVREDPKFKKKFMFDAGKERRKLVEQYMKLTGFNRDLPVTTISRYGEIIPIEK